MNKLQVPHHYKEYFQALEEDLNDLYEVAKRAKRKGRDISLEPEPQVTRDIADRIEKLIGPPGISDRMRELEGMERHDMAFQLAKEIIEGRFGELQMVEAADQAIRTSLALLTEGVTVAPIQGIPEIKIKENIDKTPYLSVYFAGPIRPAGGTAQALTLVVADHVRRELGLDRFRPSDDVIGRFIEEVRLYEQKVRRFQYHVRDEDIEHAIRNLSVEATGVSTDQFEVSNFRDVKGVDTNRLRGGALIVVVDGIVGRARKLLGICETLNLTGWEWLSDIGVDEDNDSENEEQRASFMEEIIVGRPVFSFPGRVGGFRLRYGRARTTGLAAVGVHPSTMIILNKFLCTGVQLRIELPGKSAAVTPVDSIEPPVIKLKNGGVRCVDNDKEAETLLKEVDEILFLGDVLINAGDFIQNNKKLLEAGYDESQWHQDLNSVFKEKRKNIVNSNIIEKKRLNEIVGDKKTTPSIEETLFLGDFGVPLHPRYTYPWNTITLQEFWELRKALVDQWKNNGNKPLTLNTENKRTLEKLLIPHEFKKECVVLNDSAPILERLLSLDEPEKEVGKGTPLEIVRQLSGLDVREKAPVFVGARMGRPEKAKERKMSPYVHCLFPVGSAGGPQRNILRAEQRKTTTVQIADRHCPRCGAICFGVICPECDEETVVKSRCPRCGRVVDSDNCPVCYIDTNCSHTLNLDLKTMFNQAWKRIGGPLPSRVKCVKGLMNKNKTAEPLEKGLLRARYDLSVFKDGTLRYDLTDVPLTHFKPKEIKTGVNRLQKLGYTHDVDRNPLKDPMQMLELKVQDVILPEECGEYLVKASKFLDDLLVRFYDVEPFYNINDKDEIVGQLIHGLAPHTSATIIGRVIGYTKTRVCYAHPLWHAAKRRNCDGDEDGIMLGLDPLLNFSKEFLPEQSGGLMDAPLYVIPILNPSEVDKEAHNVDIVSIYPKEFYDLCKQNASPNEYMELIETIGDRLGTPHQFEGISFTEDCSDINLGAHAGAYNTLKTMLDKLESQLDLSAKLRAVDADVVALRVLTSHFMKDIIGNLRAFTSQKFRCMECNYKYRRPPLKGVCLRCGGKLSLTVYQGGIEKYLSPALDLVEQFKLDPYYKDRLTLVKNELSSIFQDKKEEEPEKQISLIDFMRG